MDQQIQHEFDEIKKRVKALEDKYKHIDTLLDGNTKILNKISDALTGDNFSSGLIRQINKNTDLAEKNEKKINKMIWYTAGACGFAVAIVELISRFL